MPPAASEQLFNLYGEMGISKFHFVAFCVYILCKAWDENIAPVFTLTIETVHRGFFEK
jgi:hypothetical protein